MRLIAAIQLSDEMKKAVTGTLHTMKQAGIKGNYVPIQNLLIPLAVLGETKDPDAIKKALAGLSVKPFKLSFSDMGVSEGHLQVEMKGNQGLSAAVKSIRDALDAAGIEYHKDKFAPQVAIIRKVSGNWKQAPAPKGEMMVKKISLMKAASKDGKPVYTEEFSF